MTRLFPRHLTLGMAFCVAFLSNLMAVSARADAAWDLKHYAQVITPKGSLHDCRVFVSSTLFIATPKSRRALLEEQALLLNGRSLGCFLAEAVDATEVMRETARRSAAILMLGTRSALARPWLTHWVVKSSRSSAAH